MSGNCVLTREEYKAGVLSTEREIKKFSMHTQLVLSCLKIIQLINEILDAEKCSAFYNDDKKLPDIPAKYAKLTDEVVILGQHLKNPSTFIRQKTDLDPRLLHGVIGMITESGEIAETMLKVFQEGTLSKVAENNLAEEMGDIRWYQEVTCDVIGLLTAQMEYMNNQKLTVGRFPHGYDDQRVLNRDLEKELHILNESAKQEEVANG